MLSLDQMVLSKVSEFVKISKDDCPLSATIGSDSTDSDSRMVSKTFSFIFPVFFPEETSLK